MINQDDKKILKNMWILLKPYKKHIILIIICIILSSFLGMIKPWIGKSILDNGFIKNDNRVVTQLVGVSLIILFLEQGINLFRNRFQSYISALFPYTLNKMAFKKLLKLRMNYFKQTHLNETCRNLDTDIQNMSRLLSSSTFYIMTQIFTIIGGLIGLLLLDWKLTLLVMALAPIRYFSARMLSKWYRNLMEEYIQNNQDYAAWQGDSINGIKEIKVWGLTHIKIGELIRKQRKIVRTSIRLSYAEKMNEVSEEMYSQFVINALYIIGAIMITKNNLTIGGLVAFISYSMYVTAPISAIVNIGYTLSGIIPSAKRFFEAMEMPEEDETEFSEVKPLNLQQVVGELRFERVSFTYGKEIILKDLSFTIQAGDKVAIIGSNGSGKSTIIDLIIRFENPEKGCILLDGENIKQYPILDYRKLFSVVFQNIFLFNDSSWNNITLFNKHNKSRAIGAIHSSGAHKFMVNAAQQYDDNMIGVNGAKLSGGERQKIALSRALAKNGHIYIMDEVTSNMDIESEERFNILVKEELKDKSVIIITHRMGILKNMDKIIILDQGKLQDMGTHNELLGRNALYKNIVYKE